MIEKSVEIKNGIGLHARSAALFVQVASKYEAKIWINAEEKQVNAKSIMGIMSLVAGNGTVITIVADGTDENDAVQELINLVDAGIVEKNVENS